MLGLRPPDDTLLWRLETEQTEVVCFAVANPRGGMALCVERNGELMVAECDAAVDRAQELRAAIEAEGLRLIGGSDVED